MILEKSGVSDSTLKERLISSTAIAAFAPPKMIAGRRKARFDVSAGSSAVPDLLFARR
jgi:hypothetical protein